MQIQKTNVIIQARMGSTRLPGKVLKPVMGRPLLSYLLERLDSLKKAATTIIATTTNPQDDLIERFAKQNNRLLFRGSEEDVLDRFYQTCRKYPADLIVRITGDCPLMDPSIIDEALDRFQESSQSLDYLSNTLVRSFPRGMDVEVFTFTALKEAAAKATKTFDREHVTPYMYQQQNHFHLQNFTHKPDLSNFRLTVDTSEDFLLIRKILETLYPLNKKFTLDDMILAFEKHPDWIEINRHIKQKEV